MRPAAALLVIGILVSPAWAADDEPGPGSRVHIDRIVIDPAFPDAYQVEVADVDGDGKPDIVALGGATIAWYQNPTWTKRIIATGGDPLKGDIISSATVDLDGDGRAEIAIACDFAMNTPTRGQLFLASQGATLAAPWTFRKVEDVPSIHRVRWADLEGDRQPELIVAPLFGPKAAPPTYDQDMARVVEFRPDPAQPKTGKWTEREILRRPVVHAVGTTPATFDPKWGKQPGRVITADNTGVSFANPTADQVGKISGWNSSGESPIPGAVGVAPKRGSSDFQVGRLGHPPRTGFVATIDPWHGSTLAVWQSPQGLDLLRSLGQAIGTGREIFCTRTVIDATLDDGHALWTADVDGDGSDEIFAGHRGRDHRVAMYRHDGKGWNRTVLDTRIAAQDLRGGDLDADGVPDVVAVGGSTHNVVWYRPSRLARPEPAAPPR